MEIVRLTEKNKIEYAEFINIILEQNNTGLNPNIECLVAIDGTTEKTIDGTTEEATDRTTVMGFVVVDFSDEQFPLISCMYVVPNSRYLGVGSALLDAAELMCIGGEYESLSLISQKRLSTKQNLFGYNVDELKQFFENRGYFITEVELPPGEDLAIVRGNKVF